MAKLNRMRPLLGTFVEIGITTEYDQGVDVINAAFKRIEMIENLLSFDDVNSEISQLNKSGRRGIELHPVSADVLRLALHMTGVTQGDFNCTNGGALIDKGLLADHGGSRPISVGTADDVVLNGCHARLLRPVRVTLQGIIKGYAIDQAVNSLQQQGILSGWINAGGDVRVFGDVAIPIYRREINDSQTLLGEFSNSAISTSTTVNYVDKTHVCTVKAGLSWLADVLIKVADVAVDNSSNKKIVALGGELLTVLPS